MINRRSAIKWLHWLSLAIIIWFFFVEPENVQRLGALALATHAGMGIILGLLVGAWFVMYLRKGLASRAGPKLPNWAKWLHPISHRILYFGSVIMVATGAAAGFAAPYIIKAFGFLPINPGTGTRNLHNQIEDIHETARASQA